MQRALVHDALAAAARAGRRSAARRRRSRASSWPTGARALLAGALSAAKARRVDDAERASASPAQRRLIFEEFFLFQVGLILRKRRAAAEQKPRAVRVDDRIREAVRRVLPFKLTGGPEAGARARSSPTCSGRSR